jgi:DNA-binding transcriptional LysR family regulator
MNAPREWMRQGAGGRMRVIVRIGEAAGFPASFARLPGGSGLTPVGGSAGSAAWRNVGIIVGFAKAGKRVGGLGGGALNDSMRRAGNSGNLGKDIVMRRLPSLIALRFFEETARHLSFNRAALALCVTQGAVSRQIRILEDSLGTKLFERDHKGIRLTAAGAQLLPCVSEAFDTIERGTRQLSLAAGRRRLVLAVPPTFATQWFSPRLGSLAIELPDVEMSVRTEPTDDCHCSIRFGREALPDAHSELLMIERHTLVGAPSLAREPLEAVLDRMPALHVLYNDARLDLWPSWLAKARLPARYAENGIEFSNLEQAIHAARKGVGLAVVDLNMIADELAEGSLARMSGVEVIGPFGYWIDIVARHAALEHVQAFAAWMRQEALKISGDGPPRWRVR